MGMMFLVDIGCEVLLLELVYEFEEVWFWVWIYVLNIVE